MAGAAKRSPGPDSSILFIGVYSATAMTQLNFYSLRSDIITAPDFGRAWAISGQPRWVDTGEGWSQGGTL